MAQALVTDQNAREPNGQEGIPTVSLAVGVVLCA